MIPGELQRVEAIHPSDFLGNNLTLFIMSAVQIRLYDMFRKDLLLPDDRAAAFVTAVEEVIEQKEKEVINSNATRDDIRKLEQEIHKLEL